MSRARVKADANWKLARLGLLASFLRGCCRRADHVNQFAHHEAPFDSDLSGRGWRYFPQESVVVHIAEKRVPTGELGSSAATGLGMGTPWTSKSTRWMPERVPRKQWACFFGNWKARDNLRWRRWWACRMMNRWTDDSGRMLRLAT